MSEKIYVDRPPRIQPELPIGDYQIPAPPSNDQKPAPLWQAALPMVTIIGYLLVSMVGGRSAWLMIPMGLSVVVSVVMAIQSSRQRKKEQEEQEAAYAERLIEMRRELMVQHDAQRRFYQYNFPDTKTVRQIVQTADALVKQSKQITTVQRLWERRTSDADFGALRLGIGTRSSTVQYVFDGGDVDDPQTRLGVRLAEDSRYVTDIPITIPLRNHEQDAGSEALPVRYAVGITGEHPNGVYAFTTAVLANFATLHSPNDMNLFILGDRNAEGKWGWSESLPHTIDGSVCFEDQKDREVEKEESRVYRFLKLLRSILDERKLRLMDRDGDDVTLPFIVVVVDLLLVKDTTSRLRDLEMDPGIALLMNEGPTLGAAILFLTDTQNKIPSGCQTTIEIGIQKSDQDTNLSNKPMVTFRYAEIGVNTPRFFGEADVIQSPDTLKWIATTLEPLSVRKSYGADLPRAVQFMDMYKVENIEQFKRDTEQRWLESMQPDKADWLKSPIGMLSGGEYRSLKFAADADGVHGMIAGSTGSGKSELLMTMILALAANYDPRVVNFVLVDYKGGGAFKPLENLPHVVDVVTNLGESAVERMFAAIQAELNRRSGLNTQTDMKHIVEYRENNLHVTREPYPHLFVFIDEFAEMIQANPEYKAQLNSITRLGRALGVTLILAAQRPTGVTDQMRANIKFRIALRVETREESSEILRRPDAAYLPNGAPGRGYLQVGNDNIEMMQVAWCGATYKSDTQGEQKVKVRWLDRPKKGKRSQQGKSRKVFEEVVNSFIALSDEVSVPQRKPWPNFLPEQMSLQSRVETYYLELDDEISFVGIEGFENEAYAPLNPAVEAWMNDERQIWDEIDWQAQAVQAVVGLVDNPHRRSQMPLLIDFRRGHGVIFGASGWGKTAFLRTALITLTTTHSPQELHAYVLDFGGRQMSLMRDLPHVGAVITADEDERVERLLRRLDTVLERRKKRLGELGISNLWNYNANPKYVDEKLPAIVLLIDNFAEFKDSFEHLLPQLISIARESRAFGIHMLISAELPNALSNKLYSLLTERFALKLSDPTEYSGIVGRGARAIEDIPGRGFVQVGRRALEFQAALPVGTVEDIKKERDGERLIELIKKLQKGGQGIPAELCASEITTLPALVNLREVLPNRVIIAGRDQPRIRPIVGIDDFALERWSLDLSANGPHCMVVGAPNTGKTTLLRTIVLSLAYSYTPDEVNIVLIDLQQKLYRYGGDMTLSKLPHVIDTLTLGDDFMQFVQSLRHEMDELVQLPKKKRRSLFVIIDNYDSFSEEIRDEGGVLKDLSLLAREYGNDGLHFIICGSPDITRAPDGLRKQVQISSYGLAVDTQSAERIGGRVPRALRAVELPTGRGFAIKSGRTHMIQFATPNVEEDLLETALDTWVQQTRTLYDEQVVHWQQTAEPSKPEPIAEGRNMAKTNNISTGENSKVYEIPADINIVELAERVIDTGWVGTTVDQLRMIMSDAEIYQTAIENKWVEDPNAVDESET